jgi:hypothetical protein
MELVSPRFRILEIAAYAVLWHYENLKLFFAAALI